MQNILVDESRYIGTLLGSGGLLYRNPRSQKLSDSLDLMLADSIHCTVSFVQFTTMEKPRYILIDIPEKVFGDHHQINPSVYRYYMKELTRLKNSMFDDMYDTKVLLLCSNPPKNMMDCPYVDGIIDKDSYRSIDEVVGQVRERLRGMEQ